MKTYITILILTTMLSLPAQERRSSNELNSIEILGQTIKYIEKGEGETLILLHGLGSNYERWTYNIDALAKSYNVIALDQIGFGNSDKPVIPFRGNTLVAFLNEFMVQKSIEKATLVGNSMGGWVAALFATIYPDKVHKLILVNPAFLLGLPEDADADAIYSFANPTTLSDMKNYVTRIYYQNRKLLNEDSLKKMLIKKLRWNDGHTVYQIIKSLIAKKDLMTDRLSKINAPTLLIHGKHDSIVPIETIKILEKSILNSKTVIYEQSGHSPMVKEPMKFNKDVQNFLKAN
ncbi:MAG: alpha/beta hydrolase [Flavobacteriaceae bacterium]|nr:alpha/beta hydrolase [Flavobacteriaceae bacterium]